MSSGGSFVLHSEPFEKLMNLVEAIMMNISVKSFFLFLDHWFRRRCLSKTCFI